MTAVLGVLVVALVVGAWCAHIASTKHLNAAAYGLLGFLLPMIGLVVVVVEPARPAPACASCGHRA